MKSSIPILNLIIVLLENKKALIINFLIVSIVAIILSLLMTKWYRADTLFMIPDADTPAGLSSIIGAIPIDFGYSESQEGDKYITFLNSRNTIDALIDTFKLDSTFDEFEYRFELREFIREEMISAEINDDGTILISVLFPDDTLKPAIMTNYLVKKIDQLNKDLESKHAHFQRIFLENQYSQITSELTVIEDSLSKFQTQYSILDITEQLKGAISLISQLQFEKIQNDISLNLLEKYYKKDFAELNKLKSTSKILKNKINDLIFETDKSSILKSFKDVPELSLNYVRLIRDIKIKEKVLEFLIPQLEQAKVEEVKNTPSIIVIDKAIPAEYKYKPKRSILVVFIVFLTLFFHIIYIVVNEYYKNRMITDRDFQDQVKKIKQLKKFKNE